MEDNMNILPSIQPIVGNNLNLDKNNHLILD